MLPFLHQPQNCYSMRHDNASDRDEWPVCAFRRWDISSDEVASTRRCSSSKPIKPSVSLDFTLNTLSSNYTDESHPANTPPANTKHTLTPRWNQNSDVPGSSPGWPGKLCFKRCGFSGGCKGFASTAHRQDARSTLSCLMCYRGCERKCYINDFGSGKYGATTWDIRKRIR